MASLSKDEVGHTDHATTSSFDELRIRSIVGPAFTEVGGEAPYFRSRAFTLRRAACRMGSV